MSDYATWVDGSIGARIAVGAPFALAGAHFPDDFLALASDAERAALGLYPVIYAGDVADPAYYVTSDGAASFDGSTITIQRVATARPLTDRRRARVAAIDAKQQILFDRGAPYSGKFIAVDDSSRQDVDGMASTALAVLVTGGAVAWPASCILGWIAIDNSRIPLATPQDGLALAAAVGAWYGDAVQNGRTLKDTALTSDDPAGVDIETGWPA